jgi:hypothetical protein
VSAPPCPLSVPLWVHGAPPDWPIPPGVNPVHGINSWKIIRYSDYSEILQRGPWTFVKSTRGPDFADFALRPLRFSKINPRSMIFQFGPNLKNNYKKVSSLKKIHKNSSKTSKIHIFSTTTPNPVILLPKILESLPLSFYAFI